MLAAEMSALVLDVMCMELVGAGLAAVTCQIVKMCRVGETHDPSLPVSG